MVRFLFPRTRGPARCPSCAAVLYAFEWEGVELDRCGRCGGTWLDAGELETIARLARAADPAPPLALRRAARGPSAGPCPRCGRGLRPPAPAGDPEAASATELNAHAELSAHAELKMPRCPAGHGIWAEEALLRACLERFTDGVEGAIALRVMDVCRASFHAPGGQAPGGTPGGS